MAESNGRGVARRIEDDVWVIDTFYVGEPGVVASYLIESADGLALVDVGSAATVEHVLAGIVAAGHEPREVRQLVLTHVHLDHAGATGTLTRLMPDARVYVHPLGARHLIDPSRLLASATRIYGDDMERLWGTTEAVPAERVIEVADGETLRVAGRDLVALHTPGHAIHHIAYFDAARAAVFAGDVAGVRIEGMSYVRPPTPPPDLSLEDWSASIARLRALDLERLYLPHFGVATGVAAHLRQLEERLYAWGELTLAGMRAGKDTDALVADLVAASAPELAEAAGERGDEMRERYERATNYRMTVQGYERYWRRRWVEGGGGPSYSH